MEKGEKILSKVPRKPPPSTLRLMPTSLAALFIAASVGRLSHLFPRWMNAKVERKYDVTSSQLMVLFLLSQFKKMTMGQISQMLDLTPRAITGLMVGLEKKRFIIRRKDKQDQRITWVEMSEIGKDFLQVAKPDAASELGSLFQVLTKKEQIELVRIIEKLTDHMKNQLDKS